MRTTDAKGLGMHISGLIIMLILVGTLHIRLCVCTFILIHSLTKIGNYFCLFIVAAPGSQERNMRLPVTPL